MKLLNGNCLDEMDKLICDGVKVSAIIADPPYGTTACKWDSIIPFPEMWDKLNKIAIDNGAIVLFGSEPYSSKLRMSNIKNYKYDWIWNKGRGYNFVTLKYQPFKSHEIISVFSNKPHHYYPQKTSGTPYKMKQGRKGEVYSGDNNKNIITINNGDRFPLSIQKYSRSKTDIGSHPTQKPVKLLEYLIKTYTKENDTVLDFTMGSGTTGVACGRLKRNFIGIELNKKYYKIACDRIKKEG